MNVYYIFVLWRCEYKWFWAFQLSWALTLKTWRKLGPDPPAAHACLKTWGEHHTVSNTDTRVPVDLLLQFYIRRDIPPCQIHIRDQINYAPLSQRSAPWQSSSIAIRYLPVYRQLPRRPWLTISNTLMLSNLPEHRDSSQKVWEVRLALTGLREYYSILEVFGRSNSPVQYSTVLKLKHGQYVSTLSRNSLVVMPCDTNQKPIAIRGAVHITNAGRA